MYMFIVLPNIGVRLKEIKLLSDIMNIIYNIVIFLSPVKYEPPFLTFYLSFFFFVIS